MWGENGSIYSDKIFSKASDYEPTFIIRDQKGNQSMVKCEPNEHFITMFEYFGKMIGNNAFVQNEYDHILERAFYLEEINKSHNNHGTN